jgi:hypothetical protein
MLAEKTHSVHPPVEVRESYTQAATILLGSVLLFGHGIYYHEKYSENIDQMVYLVLMSVGGMFVLYESYQLLNRNVIMRIDDSGIFHKKFGLLKWEQILSIKKKKKTDEEDGEVFLLLQTPNVFKPFEINVSNLQISETELIRIIRKFRDYVITEIHDDDW